MQQLAPSNRVCIFQLILADIEAAMVRVVFVLSSNTCELGADHVYIDPRDHSKGVVVDVSSRNVRMSFVGPLTLIPSIGAVEIAKVDGLRIYVRSKNLATKHGPGYTPQLFVPAWLVEPALTNVDGTVIETPTAKLTTNTLTVPIKFTKQFLGGVTALAVEVSLYTMTCNPDTFGTKNLVLTRPPLPGEVLASSGRIKAWRNLEKALKEKYAAGDARPDKADKAAKNKKDEWQADAKHILM